MSPGAIVLTDGLLDDIHGKTAHGLIRGTTRYRILGVIDPVHRGRDAGEVTGGVTGGVPVFGTVAEAGREIGETIDYAIIGVATAGGVIPPSLRAEVLVAIASGLGVVNGLHQLLSDDEEIARAATERGVELVDIRRPRRVSELRFWTGEVAELRATRVALLGTDCAVGKRTTGRFLVEGCRAAGIAAEMIYTGQTGWLEGWSHGLILDATPNDFVSGELEGAVLRCAAATDPDVIFIEGQSAFRNPSGPCGSELICSACRPSRRTSPSAASTARARWRWR